MSNGYGEYYESCSEEVQDSFDTLVSSVEAISEYDAGHGILFFALDKVGHDSVQEYLDVVENSGTEFWYESDYTNIREYISQLWFTTRLLNKHSIPLPDGLTDRITNIKSYQERSGRLPGEDLTPGTLVLLNSVTPNSEASSQATEYLLNNLENEARDVRTKSLATIALSEKSYHSYKSEINQLAKEIVDNQNDNGSFGRITQIVVSISGTEKKGKYVGIPYDDTLFALVAIHRSEINEPEAIERAEKFLLDYRSEDSTWSGTERRIGNFQPENSNIRYSVEDVEQFRTGTAFGGLHTSGIGYSTSLALSGLCYTSKGPTVPFSELEWKIEKESQRRAEIEPQLYVTEPNVNEGGFKSEIRDVVERMISNTENELLIASPYLDLLHEQLIDLTVENDEICVKLVTRPLGDFSGSRQRIAKAAVEQVNRSQSRHVRKNRIIHSRFLVRDSDAVLVSSADLTREQLVDEYNAGIYTKMPEVVSKCAEFFHQLWESSDPL